MKIRLHHSKQDWLISLFVIPFIAVALAYRFLGNRFWMVTEKWLSALVISIVISFSSWFVYRLSIKWLRMKYPDIRQTAIRVVLLGGLHVGLVLLTLSAVFFCYAVFQLSENPLSTRHYYTSLIIGGAFVLIGTPLREGLYLYRKWKESLLQKETVQQLAIKQEFELLKQQVDPHFLFNCFNTLSSLLTEDIEQAHLFLKELRKVYHYLLTNKEQDFVTLEQELQFIQSYYTLLQTRFGNALALTITVDARHLKDFIPSLSLQLLVENAVKHNIASKARKLFITIASNGNEELVVTNNLQRKLNRGRSFGIGMETIKTKYKIARQKTIQIEEKDGLYTVILPIIRNKQYTAVATKI